MTEPYGFGFPDVLVRINFPDKAKNNGLPPSQSAPWFWWCSPKSKPYYFQYVFQAGGWIRTQNFPIIKILPIDTQVLTPTIPLGFDTLEAAIDAGPNFMGPDVGWGRFEFDDPFFWRVIGQKKPEFQVIQGRPTQAAGTRQPPIGQVIGKAVKSWRDKWNFGANAFNRNAANSVGRGFSVAPDGTLTDHTVPYPFPPTQFAVPLPTDPTIAGLLAGAQSQSFYLGPIPGGFWFEQGTIAIYKQAYSFNVNVAQLSFDKWRFDTFPPRRTGIPGSITTSGGVETLDCSGYGQTTFPLAGPQIIGGNL